MEIMRNGFRCKFNQYLIILFGIITPQLLCAAETTDAVVEVETVEPSAVNQVDSTNAVSSPATSADTASPATTKSATTTNIGGVVSLEKVYVTGSHIKRLDIEGPSPILTLDREQIEKSAAGNLSELLRDLSINNGESYNELLTQSTTPGSSGINLRGLGQDATLVLLNGRRVANYAFSLNTTDTFVDLNSIPLGAIERIEILKDGASAIYGSDALAGVINIILRKDYDESVVTLEHGKSAQGDADETRLNIATGISNGTDNITFLFDYFQRGSFLMGDRDFSKTAFPADAYDFGGGAEGIDWTTWDFFPANGYDPVFTDPWPLGCTDPNLDFCYGFFDVNPYMTAIPGTERIGGLITMNREVNASMSFFSELMINQTVTEYQSAPTALYGDIDNVIFPTAHPENTSGADLFLYWRMTDAGPRRETVETNSQRFVAGLEGSSASVDWVFDLNYNRSSSVVTGVNYINRLALVDAFNNGLLNPFGTSDPDEMNNVKASISRKGISELYGTQGKINTEIGELQGGPIGIAAGVEHRYESLTDTPDDLTEQGQVIGQLSTRSSGDRTLTSVFGEASLPVTDDMEIQVAARMEAYSDFGKTINPKLAARYQPNSTVVLRGSWGTGFRAPSLPELYQSQTSVYGTLVDTTRCNAVGLDCAPAQTLISFSGNEDLDPEKSESIYLGAVFEPMNNFSVGLDYWQYKQSDIIDSDTQIVLDNEAQYVGRVVRGPSTGPGDPGPIDAINGSYINVAEQKTNGIDISVEYLWKVSGVGNFTIQSMVTRVLSFERRETSGSSFEDLLGTFRFPELRGNLTLGWEKADLAALITGNYIGEYKDDFYGIDIYGNGPVDSNRDNHMIDAYISYDAQIVYSGIPDSKLTFGIRNLTDQDPPFSNASHMGYDSATHNPRGRFYSARYTAEF